MATAPNVEDYLASVSGPARAALQSLRDTIRAAAPDATETISYRIPTFKFGGRSLVAYAAFRSHCSLFPMSMSVIDALEQELMPYRASKGTIHFQPDHPLPKALVRKIIKARVAEIRNRA